VTPVRERPEMLLDAVVNVAAEVLAWQSTENVLAGLLTDEK
jgi:hypothetical protein